MYGTSKMICNVTNGSYAISMIALCKNKVLITHSGGSNYYIYGCVCKIVDNNITTGTDTSIFITYGYTGYTISSVKLSEMQICVACNKYTNTYNLMIIMCTIVEMEIQFDMHKTISESSYTGRAISAVMLESKNAVFIGHSYTSSLVLNGCVCQLEKNTYISRATDAIERSSVKNTAMMEKQLNALFQII